jgi:hypothetical protein
MRRFLLLAILVGIGFLASSDTVSLGAPDVSTRAASGQPEGDDKDKDEDKNRGRAAAIDDLLAEVAKKHPEFGGMFIDEDEDTIVVFLLRDGDLDAVVKTLKRVFGEQNLPQRNARARTATYSFQQLKKWHDRLAERVFEISEVHLTDINDDTNRLTVGIENLDARDRVEEQLEALNIPREAVEIEEIGPFQLDQVPAPPECEEDVMSINDRCRPLVGGLQIDISREAGIVSAGTLGFIAERGEDEGFVTNSHVSNIAGEPDGTVYYQPIRNGNNRIGT